MSHFASGAALQHKAESLEPHDPKVPGRVIARSNRGHYTDRPEEQGEESTGRGQAWNRMSKR